MARNEEKQFGQLNRLHLQKQKDEELKRNPRRPKLHMLESAEMIRKWLPSITRDLDFQCKQLAVPCYPEYVVDNINKQISALKSEYHAFVNKLRSLEPDHAITDHRYRSQLKRASEVELERPVEAKRAMTELVKDCRKVDPSSSEEVHSATSVSSQSSSAESSTARIPLPLLSGSVEAQYRAERTEEATTLVWNCDKLKCDEPLQLRLPLPSKQRTPVDCSDSSPVHFSAKSKQTRKIDESNAFSALIAAYDDDAEEQ